MLSSPDNLGQIHDDDVVRGEFPVQSQQLLDRDFSSKLAVRGTKSDQVTANLCNGVGVAFLPGFDAGLLEEYASLVRGSSSPTQLALEG